MCCRNLLESIVSGEMVPDAGGEDQLLKEHHQLLLGLQSLRHPQGGKLDIFNHSEPIFGNVFDPALQLPICNNISISFVKEVHHVSDIIQNCVPEEESVVSVVETRKIQHIPFLQVFRVVEIVKVKFFVSFCRKRKLAVGANGSYSLNGSFS